MTAELDDAQDQTQGPRFTDNERHDTQRPSRSVSATVESMVAADYHEWPINGLFKQTRSGNRASFHLKFHLTNTSDHLELSAPFASLGSTLVTSVQRQVSHSDTARFQTYCVTSWGPRKRVEWITEEDASLVKMKEEHNYSWEEISAALRPGNLAQSKYATTRSSGVVSLYREEVEGSRTMLSSGLKA